MEAEERKCPAGYVIATLMVGAPGTGKTLLGKAVAGEAGVLFFSRSRPVSIFRWSPPAPRGASAPASPT